MTFTPDRVVNPSLPAVIGIVRASLPPMATVITCFVTSTWETTDLDETAAKGRAAWEFAKERLAAGEHDLLILDEMTYAITYGWIDVDDVVMAIRDRPPGVNVVVTGRDAPEELIAIADTVTEMRKVKHAFDSGIRAIKGIEY